MRSRRSGSGWPSGDTRVFGRRVTSKAPSAHVEGGSGHSEASPTAILQDTHSVEGKFSEVKRPSRMHCAPVGGIMLVVERDDSH
jgi:hypothetical protein